MKKYLVLLLLPTVYCNDHQNLLEKFAESNRQFTVDLYKEIKDLKSGNLLLCPVSVEVILALTRMGAKGATGSQLSQALYLSDNTTEIEQIFKVLTPRLESTAGSILNSAIQIFVKGGYQIQEDFVNIAQSSFASGVREIDFGRKEDAADSINNWVSQQTGGKVKGLIDPRKLTKGTRVVLVNALYFKSTWVITFDEKLTQRKPFYVNDEEQVEVDMMEVTEYYNYHNSDKLKAQIVEMPYVGGEYSMVVVLPHEKNGLGELENRLGDVLQLAEGYEAQVRVQLPKFKVETKVELTDVLKNLGVKDAFEDHADFSGCGVPGDEPLKISNVVQKTVIEVDEQGTTAAAATGVHGVATLSLLRPVIYEFNADHPFIYYVKGPSGVMFIGRYVTT